MNYKTCKKYNKEKNIQDFSKCNKCYKKIKEMGFKNSRIQKNNEINKYSDEIIKKYTNGMNMPDIANIFNTSKFYISKILKNNNVELRDISKRRMKYHLDHGFFKNIDTEEKAYWVGFLMADGCISKKITKGGTIKNTIDLRLAEIDEKHIEKFKKSLKSGHKISKRGIKYLKGQKISNSVRINISSKEMVDDLIKFGVTPNKTFTATPPLLKENLQKHFFRGLIDGDGSLGIYKTDGIKYPRINLVGSYNACMGFSTWASKQLKRKDIAKVSKKSKIYSVSFSATFEVAKLCSILYENSTIYLDRKFKTSNEIIEYVKYSGLRNRCRHLS
jgi:hypothetical protein